MRHSSDRVTPLMPPRKRDWKPGTYQLGLFLRMPDGATLEMVTGPDGPSAAELDAALQIYRGELADVKTDTKGTKP